MMRSADVWPAMAEAYEATIGRGLSAALLAALDAAELAGGDLRGRQAAAILIVPAEGTDADRLLDVRVEDSPEPLQELHRLVALNGAYLLADQGDQLLAERGLRRGRRPVRRRLRVRARHRRAEVLGRPRPARPRGCPTAAWCC